MCVMNQKRLKLGEEKFTIHLLTKPCSPVSFSLLDLQVSDHVNHYLFSPSILSTPDSSGNLKLRFFLCKTRELFDGYSLNYRQAADCLLWVSEILDS